MLQLYLLPDKKIQIFPTNQIRLHFLSLFITFSFIFVFFCGREGLFFIFFFLITKFSLFWFTTFKNYPILKFLFLSSSLNISLIMEIKKGNKMWKHLFFSYLFLIKLFLFLFSFDFYFLFIPSLKSCFFKLSAIFILIIFYPLSNFIVFFANDFPIYFYILPFFFQLPVYFLPSIYQHLSCIHLTYQTNFFTILLVVFFKVNLFFYIKNIYFRYVFWKLLSFLSIILTFYLFLPNSLLFLILFLSLFLNTIIFIFIFSLLFSLSFYEPLIFSHSLFFSHFSLSLFLSILFLTIFLLSFLSLSRFILYLSFFLFDSL